MIDEKQAIEFSKTYNINMFTIIREFIQISLLNELYNENFASDIFFKGGTAIRILYGGKRFSEDLDFTSQISEKIFDEKINKFFNKLEKTYSYKFKKKKSLIGKTYLLTAQIPYLKNNIYLKLDFSEREKVIEPQKVILKTEYPIISHNFIYTLSKDEIIAEKIRAVYKRIKSRDLYDIWTLLQLGGKININLIDQKLRYYNEKFNRNTVKERLKLFTQDDFVKDLRAFVPIKERNNLGNLFEYVKAFLDDHLLSKQA